MLLAMSLLLALGAVDLDEPAIVAAAKACRETDNLAQWKYLVGEGPDAFPVVSQVWTSEKDLPRLRRLAEDIAHSEIARSAKNEPDLRYHGQFSRLKPLGPIGASVVLDLFRSDDVPVRLRTRAATALGDLGEPSVVPALHDLVEDFLVETWCAREAGFVMARLGDRRHVDQWLAAGQKIVAGEVTASNLTVVLAAHSDLAELHYRIEEYALAVQHYEKKMDLLRNFRDRIPAEMREPVDLEIALLHYNLACSLALAGRTDDALAALENSLASPGVTLAMIEHDGDLRALRTRPDFKEWFARIKIRRAPKTGGGESEEEKNPPPEGDRG